MIGRCRDLLPVLVADLVEESARDFLEEVARDNEEAWVPLVAAPVDTSRHLARGLHADVGRAAAADRRADGATDRARLPASSLAPLRRRWHEALRVPTVEHVAVGFEVTIESAARARGAGRRSANDQRARGARFARARLSARTRSSTRRHADASARRDRASATPVRSSTSSTTPSSRATRAGEQPQARDALVGRALAGRQAPDRVARRHRDDGCSLQGDRIASCASPSP